jgi:hypothetical protein
MARAAIEEPVCVPLMTYEPLGLQRTYDLQTLQTAAHLWPAPPGLRHTHDLLGLGLSAQAACRAPSR